MDAGHFVPDDVLLFKQQALQWAAGFDTCTYLDSNNNNVYGSPEYDLLIGAGAESVLQCPPGAAFDQLKAFHSNEWLFGFLGYDLKNETEQLHSRHPDHVHFPAMMFFKPKYRLEMKGGVVRIFPEGQAAQVWRTITGATPKSPKGDLHTNASSTSIHPSPRGEGPGVRSIELKPRFTKDEYTNTISKLREHIAEGDVYEITMCQEFYADGAVIEPTSVFEALNKKSQAPFASFVKYDGKYLMGASPERFLKKQGNKLTSQPIKGTLHRGKDATEDETLKQQLYNDLKERAENVMIVDLVRNDLSRVCKAGTVKVDELFGIYSFPQVHQMVSTVSGQLDDEIHFTDAIKNTFPMGSMTGAPKVMAMELIEQYERTRRGLYSGAVGYITPDGDFDLNVVIRSIQYNANDHYLSYQVGGAITWGSDPEREYEECMLKAQGMREVLGGQSN